MVANITAFYHGLISKVHARSKKGMLLLNSPIYIYGTDDEKAYDWEEHEAISMLYSMKSS